jgi:UDP-N-acetylmuramate: L-alanyl-gamma-D-glutamyl-meso-diaminopimelate ligase
MQSSVRKIHFLGVCGTAMGAVAAAIREKGFIVTGSDENVYPPMSDFLAAKDVKIRNGYRSENIPAEVDLIVVGNAIVRGNPEMEAVLNRKLLYRSLPETLRDFFLHGKRNIVITGTHGKTTTTSLLAWVFERADCSPSFLIGGIARDLAKGAAFRDSDYFIIEGDEYDSAFFDKRSKFLHYLPETVVINNIEFDHADIFSSLDEIKLSFRRLVHIVPTNGRIFVNADDPNCAEVASASFAKVDSVGFAEGASHRITGVAYHETGSSFRFMNQEFRIPLIGEFNVRNAAMAAAVALHYGLPAATIQNALQRFSGVARRQELRGEANGIKIIDDFGHHPTAIQETLLALRLKYPGARIWAIFEPRSNTTRRAVFQNSLPQALKIADGVILARVARSEELPPGDRLDPEKVIESIKQSGVTAFYEPDIESILRRIKPLAKPGDAIVVFSNGGFDGLHQKLLDRLSVR